MLHLPLAEYESQETLLGDFVTFRLVLKRVIVTGVPPIVVGGLVILGVSQQLDLARLPYCCSCSRPSVAIPCERVTTVTAVPLL